MMVWHALGLDHHNCFYSTSDLKQWVLQGIKAHGSLFLSTLWGIWKSRNKFIFEARNIPVWDTVYSIFSLANIFQRNSAPVRAVREPLLVQWEPPSGDTLALNIDGSVRGNKAGFGGLVRNNVGKWQLGFFGHLGEKDILFAELTAILRGLHICWEKDFKNVQCWSDSQTTVNLILMDVSHFHLFANLVKEIRGLLNRDWVVSINHKVCESNMCADFLAKKGAEETSSFCILQDPPDEMLALLSADALGIFYTRF
ncbi:Ribonuclease H domain [Sesbania bispinosa]|nr:Ribonuclease H domain [Sesbania bispinosa]